MNILYISEGYQSTTVFMSQVHTLCNYHAEKHNVKVLAMCNHKEFLLDGKIKGSLYSLKKIYRLPKMFIPTVMKLKIFFTSKAILNDFKNANIIHCRGHVASAYAILIKEKYSLKVNIISDIRGAMVEEVENTKSKMSSIYKKQVLKLEQIVFAKSDYFFFVSENMSKHYKEIYNFKQKFSVFPTIVDEKYFYISKSDRLEIRDKLKIENRTVYIYSGGVHYWQNIDKIIRKFHEINMKNPNKYFFIILTHEVKFVYDFCNKEKINLKNFYISKVPYIEVGKYLNASDYGVIIRDKNIINYVASPTKINEYLACGLRIVDTLMNIGEENPLQENQYKYKNLNDILHEQNLIYLEYSND